MEENISALVETSKADPVSLDNESGYEEGLNNSLDAADITVTTEDHLDSLMLTIQNDIDSGRSSHNSQGRLKP